MVQHHNGAPVGVDEAAENVNAVETETLLSRSKQGALLFRYDNYRTVSGIFGSSPRTGIINSAYAKLEPAQPALFDWEVTAETAPPPARSGWEPGANPEAALVGAQQSDQLALPPGSNAQERPANLSAVLVDVQQYAMGQLPAGASISHFLLDKASADNALWISMKGQANRNQDVSDLLRAMDQHAQLQSVELVSVQRSAENKIDFAIRLKLKSQAR